MPMIRYEIRNEYNLADPEVYRASDKDDPEALLEGVAMVGLVGVLRQLGDLAEFAAAIFHNLHEEVMATASRGHILMIRVEQLEAEIPSIEKLFLSQTDHSSLFYNGGVDLHPNLQMDQNLITQGYLPRFIMDSYEECRGPPRLFLLDKFDVAGAGACLKRYTDPSFFGVETSSSGMTKAYVQREKRTHKVNKKELNWRNGETSEVIPTSHAKLHQLFLKESVTNSISNPARHVKLERRPNGVPFDSKNGERYMEKLLRNPSPEHNVVHEVSVSSSLLKLPTHDHNESGVEVLEVIPLSPDMGRKSSMSSPNTEKIMLKPSVYESIELSADDSLIQVPKSITSFEAVDISCAFDLVTSEEDITVDGESKEGSLNGYHSDDVSTEIDYYVDAPSTIESDMYTDSEWRGKSDFTSSNMKKQLSISNTDDEYLQSHSSDSQSIGHSIILDEGNNSYKKETYNFSSDSVEMDGITCCMDSTGNKETDIISPNGVHVQFVEIDPETDQYDAVDVATVVTGSAVNADENDFLSVGHMLKEGCIPFYGDSSHDDFKTDKYWHPYSHGESILVEEVDQLEVATSHLDSVDNVPNSCISLEVENSLNLVNTTVIKLSLEKRGLYTEQESEQKSSLSSRTEDASYLPINPHTEETILQETIGLLPNTLDLEFPEAGETDLELFPTSKSMQKFDHNDYQGCNNSTYTLSDLPPQGNYENDYFGHPKNLSSSIFPLINLHSETNQINLEESPPLPPLPPLQWRIGKLNNTYRATERDTEQHNVICLSSVLPMEADKKTQSLLPNLPLSAVIKKDSPSVDDEMTQDCFLAGEGKIMLHTLESSSRGISLDSPSVDDVGSSFEELNQSLHQVAAEITSKEDKAEYNSSCLQSNIMKHETVELLPMKDNEKPLLVLPPSEYEITLPVAEDGIENGSRTTKLPRPRNPLIDAVVAHDKSKLRKVTERVRPQRQSIDEKGSFLEQIRTKSFNLKPAVMAKPSIQGPNTNLKVAALLEKAKTIRQALASSNEDDEDSWSDS